MYSHYSPNPHGKRVGDCVVRALSKATDKSWEEIYQAILLWLFLFYQKEEPAATANSSRIVRIFHTFFVQFCHPCPMGSKARQQDLPMP